MKGKKKGNVDTDIVYEIMKCSYENLSDKIVLVSGDGDYIKTVKHLIKHKKLKKILFPNNNYSSLYKSIVCRYGMNISLERVRKIIEYKKEK